MVDQYKIFEYRIEKIYRIMEENQIFGVIFNDSISLRYFLGIHIESESYLIFSQYFRDNYKKLGILLVPQLEAEKAKKDIEILPIEIRIMKNRNNLKIDDEIIDILGFNKITLGSSNGGFRIGILYSYLNLNSFKKIFSNFFSISNNMNIFKYLDSDIIDFSQYFFELRSIKESDEIEKIRIAAKITDDAFKVAVENLKDGITEIELAAIIEYEMRKRGAEKPAFNTIIASGPNSWFPHANATNRVIKNGEIVTIDIGAQYNGYCSDMTRTLLVGPPPYKKDLCNLINKVNISQQKAIISIKPKIRCKDIDHVARQYLDSEGLGKYFIHGLGHSVGLEIHEYKPILSNEADCILKEGMVVTIEPGVYIPNLGGARTEDLVLITNNGCEKLSNSEIFWYN